MSSGYAPYVNQKQIKIRPIENIRKEPIEEFTTETIDLELINKQTELKKIKQELLDVQQEHEASLKQTIEKIELEKKKWEEEKKQLISETKQQAYNEGFSAGEKASLDHYAELIKQTNQIVDSATEDYHSTIENSEDTILTLAIKSAEKIIQMKLEEKPELFSQIVKSAIKDIKEQSTIAIYLHPENYQLVLDQKDELARLLDSNSKLTIFVKEGLAENSCLIEHPLGQVDASIDTQLKQLRAILHEVNMENKE